MKHNWDFLSLQTYLNTIGAVYIFVNLVPYYLVNDEILEVKFLLITLGVLGLMSMDYFRVKHVVTTPKLRVMWVKFILFELVIKYFGYLYLPALLILMPISVAFFAGVCIRTWSDLNENGIY